MRSSRGSPLGIGSVYQDAPTSRRRADHHSDRENSQYLQSGSRSLGQQSLLLWAPGPRSAMTPEKGPLGWGPLGWIVAAVVAAVLVLGFAAFLVVKPAGG